MANRIGRCSANVRRFSISSRSGVGSYDWPKDRPKAFPNVYNSANVENGWYEWWEKNNFFKPSTSSDSTKCQPTALSKKDDEKFSLILPPPNVTGTLHLGHALTITVQDIVTRWHRMRGFEAVWVPGVDHAGIATQVVVEKQLRKERNISRQDIGRERFVNEVWKWKNEKGDVITKQLRTLGASFDWSKEFFTMDDDRTKAVNEAMVRLWDSGLLFREPALVNWCCCLQSAISDIEVDEREISGPTDIEVPGYTQPVQFGLLTDFAYKLINSDEEVVVSTTRLETMMGDVAVAVHPEDPRYRSLHGATLWHPLRHIPIPLICDKDVDKDFATGAVKITPAHDATDLRIAKRHGLPIISVINEDGVLNDFLHSPFSGMKRFDARNAILQELKDQDLFRGHKPHEYKLPVCSRSGDVIEYILKPQWFIDCKVMSKRAAAAVKNGDLQIFPESYSKIWLSWLENIREWNISRQIWWGHQLPLYEAVPMEGDSNVSIWVVANSLADAESKSAEILNKDISQISIRQDPDVLDTWFSSALLPFSAFGWPSQTESLDKNYPLSIMVTGHDILFFWVARMVMLGLQITGRLPFNKVFLHGIVCDAQGRKMSKSLGNVINPEDIVKGVTLKDLNETVLKSCSSGLINEQEKEKALVGQKLLFPDGIPDCGTDALRFTLASQIVTKHFINFDVNECITNRSFCNKIWQAFRYVFTKISQLDVKIEEPISTSFNRINMNELNHMDRWILSRLSNAVDLMNSSLSNIELHNATAAFKQFFYHEFCDIYLETTKPVLNKGLSSESRQSINVLLFCLDNSLRMMSPFMPYLAEELNMWMPATTPANSVMTSQFPSDLQNFEDKSLEKEVDDVLEVVTSVRRIKASHGLQHKNTKVEISSEKVDLLRKHVDLITALLRDELTITGDEIAAEVNTDHNIAIEPHSYHTRIAVHLQGGATSLSEEQIQLLIKKEAKVNKTLHKLLQTISNKGFEEKAPQHVQIAHKEKVRGLQEELVTIKKKLESAGIIKDESKRETG